LHGKEFDLLGCRRCWGEERVYFHDEEGSLRAIPTGWTSAAPEDPFLVVSAGRSRFRVEDLLRLAQLIVSEGSAQEEPADKGAGSRIVK
jgi:hypothetical protein